MIEDMIDGSVITGTPKSAASSRSLYFSKTQVSYLIHKGEVASDFHLVYSSNVRLQQIDNLVNKVSDQERRILAFYHCDKRQITLPYNNQRIVITFQNWWDILHG